MSHTLTMHQSSLFHSRLKACFFYKSYAQIDFHKNVYSLTAAVVRSWSRRPNNWAVRGRLLLLRSFDPRLLSP